MVSEKHPHRKGMVASGLMSLVLTALLLASPASAALTAVSQFGAPQDPLYDTIQDRVQVQDKSIREAIMKDMKAWEKSIEDGKLNALDLSFLSQDNQAFLRGVTTGADAVSTGRDKKMSVDLAAFPRQLGPDAPITMAIRVRVNHDIPVEQHWEATLAKKGGTWAIDKVDLLRTVDDSYYNDSVQFVRAPLKDPVRFEYDSVDVEFRDGDLFLGYVYYEQPGQRLVSMYFKGEGEVKYYPVGEVEEFFMEKHYNKESYKETIENMLIEASPQRLTDMYESFNLNLDRDPARESDARDSWVDFQKEPGETSAEFMDRVSNIVAHPEDLELRFTTDKDVRQYYRFYADRDDLSAAYRSEIDFGVFREQAGRDEESVIRWSMMDRKEERELLKLDKSNPEERQKYIDLKMQLSRENKEKIDLLHAKALIEVRMSGTGIDSDVALRFKSLQDNVEEVELAFHPVLQISSMVDEQGREIFVDRGRLGSSLESFTFTMPLVPAMNKGEERTVYIKSGGDGLMNQYAGGLHMAPAYFVPDYGYLGNKSVDFLIGVPRGNTAVSVGTMQTKFDEGRYTYFHWKEPMQVALPNFMFGDYAIISEKEPRAVTQLQEPLDIQAYYSTAAIQYFVGKVQNYYMGADTSGDVVGGSGYIQQLLRDMEGQLQSVELSNIAEAQIKELGTITAFFTKMFGAYPFGKLAIAQLPYGVGYGQGWPSLLVMEGGAFLSDESKRITGWDRAGEVFHMTFLAHEVSHQWWGHVVPWMDPGDQWLSEAMAQISCALYAQSRYGQEAYPYILKRWDNTGQYADMAGPMTSGYHRLTSRENFLLMYQKGGYIMHSFRMMLPTQPNPETGQAEERLLIDLLGRYCDYVRQQPPEKRPATTIEFQVFVEKMLGEKNLQNMYGRPNLDWWFDQWIYGWGRPEYVIVPEIKNKGRNDSEVTVTLVQEQEEQQLYRALMTVSIYYKNGKKDVKHVMTEAVKRQEFTFSTDSDNPRFKLEGPVHKILFDEYDQVYSDKRYAQS